VRTSPGLAGVATQPGDEGDNFRAGEAKALTADSAKHDNNGSRLSAMSKIASQTNRRHLFQRHQARHHEQRLCPRRPYVRQCPHRLSGEHISRGPRRARIGHPMLAMPSPQRFGVASLPIKAACCWPVPR
jgi:hypothetical protein